MSDALRTSSAQFRLALCSRLALPQGSADKTFGPTEFTALESILTTAGITDPTELIGRAAAEISDMLSLPRADAERIARLLSRSGQIAVEVERLSGRGIWVLTRGDAGYPQRWTSLLGDRAPVVLFGAGDRRLLACSGIAVVGSRNVSEEASQYARGVGEVCAQAGMSVISGVARGIDRAAMAGALDNGGSAVGVLADDLTRVIREPETRQWIENNRLVLVKDYHYSAPFSVGQAMARNKLIYCLSEAAVVVASEETGGTWEGAKENLKAGWVPLFVRADEPVPPGNSALLSMGGRALHGGEMTAEFVTGMRETGAGQPVGRWPEQSTLAFEP